MKKWLYNNVSTLFIVILLFLLFAAFTILSYLSDGSYIGGDTYVRYTLARYAFQYPINFFNHWGKPIYIAVASPFAQFGYNGFKLFNICTGILTALFSYLICKKLKFENSWLVMLFVCFSPVYYMLMFTGMTEIFFSFIIILSIYFIVNNKYIVSAIILSFLPIIRNEGIAIWVLFIFLYSIRKQYKSIPFLLSAFIIYSICGLFYYHDFWWLINQNPYKPGGNSIYGHGEWNFYFTNLRITIGSPLKILFIIGFISFIYILVFKNKIKTNLIDNNIQIILLIISIIATYFSLHSILWWKGWMSVYGDTRFMAAITPLAAIISLYGFNFIIRYFSIHKIIIYFISVLFVVFLIRNTKNIYPMPVHLIGTDVVVKDAAKWIKNNNLDTNKIFYWDPFFPIVLDINPYYNVKVECFVKNLSNPEIGTNKGDLILWDAHYSPNEGNLPLVNLSNNKNFTILKVFKPEKSFTILGGYNYEIYIFQRN